DWVSLGRVMFWKSDIAPVGSPVVFTTAVKSRVFEFRFTVTVNVAVPEVPAISVPFWVLEEIEPS
ncbi:MAG: hypothetical protein ACO3FI_04185, partial [Cyclobacteriaceae bacterium]